MAERYRILPWPFQLGAAMTLPTHWGPVVLVADLEAWETDAALRAHEEVHVAQIERMGGCHYLLAHLAQRVHPWAMWRRWRRGGCMEIVWASDAPLEAEAYTAEEAV